MSNIVLPYRTAIRYIFEAIICYVRAGVQVDCSQFAAVSAYVCDRVVCDLLALRQIQVFDVVAVIC